MVPFVAKVLESCADSRVSDCASYVLLYKPFISLVLTLQALQSNT